MAAMTGGSKLLAAVNLIAEKVSTKKRLRVGFLENATYPDGTSVASVAAFNEFGVPAHNQPPRPFFRSMIGKNQGLWGDELAGILKATDYDVDRSLSLMGERMRGQLQGSIKDLSSPALSPRTIKRKGFEKPLVDTGHMLNSVDYDIGEPE